MSFVRLPPLHDIPAWSQTAVPPRNTRSHCGGCGVCGTAYSVLPGATPRAADDTGAGIVVVVVVRGAAVIVGAAAMAHSEMDQIRLPRRCQCQAGRRQRECCVALWRGLPRRWDRRPARRGLLRSCRWRRQTCCDQRSVPPPSERPGVRGCCGWPTDRRAASGMTVEPDPAPGSPRRSGEREQRSAATSSP